MLGRLLTSDFSNSDAGLRCCLQVHVVAADARSERQLELLRLGDALGGEVAREEGRGDDLLSTCSSAAAASQRHSLASGQHAQASEPLQDLGPTHERDCMKEGPTRHDPAGSFRAQANLALSWNTGQ